MDSIEEGRERLQQALVILSRRSARRGPPRVRRRTSTPPPEPVTARRAVPEPPVGAGHAAPVAARLEEMASGAPAAPAGPQMVEALLQRLDRIEERLAGLQGAARPDPASRDAFLEWVRLAKWQEIPFVDFLSLRRAGRL